VPRQPCQNWVRILCSNIIFVDIIDERYFKMDGGLTVTIQKTSLHERFFKILKPLLGHKNTRYIDFLSLKKVFRIDREGKRTYWRFSNAFSMAWGSLLLAIPIWFILFVTLLAKLIRLWYHFLFKPFILTIRGDNVGLA